jgi:hypothetical protein
MQDWQDADDAFNRTLDPYDHEATGDFDRLLWQAVDEVMARAQKRAAGEGWGEAVTPE